MTQNVDNTRFLLQQLHVQGPIPRAELARLTGLTEAAVSRITRRLIDKGLVQEGAKATRSGSIGRPFVELSFGKGAYVAAIGIRTTHQWVQIADLSGTVVAQRSFQAEDLSDATSLLARCATELQRVIDAYGVPGRCLLGIGIAIAAVVDHERGLVLRADTFGLGRIEIAAYFRERFGLPVVVDTYLNSMNRLLHRFAPAQGVKQDVAIVVVGIASGASFIVGGQLVHGGLHGAAQIGHVRVAGATDQCVCGARGCLDTVATARALLKRAGQDLGEGAVQTPRYYEIVARYKALVESARSNRKKAAILEEGGAQMGRALATVSTMLDPRTFLIGGFAVANEWYWTAMAKAFHENVDPRLDPAPVLEQLGSEAEDMAPLGIALHEFVFNAPRNQPDRLLELAH